jgi:hypothetical protein
MKLHWRSRLATIVGSALVLGGPLPAATAAPASGPAKADVMVGPAAVAQVAALVRRQSDLFSGVTLDVGRSALTVYEAAGVGRQARADGMLREALSQGPTKQGGLRIVVQSRQRSMAELESVQASLPLREPFASAVRDALSTWYVDPATNTVRVGVLAVTPRIRRAAAETYGSAVTLETRSRYTFAKKVIQLPDDGIRRAGAPVPAAIAPSPSRLLDSQPYLGGDQIGVLANNLLTLCTAAFPNVARTRMLTAGHCFPANAVVQQGYYESSVNAFITTGIVGRVDWRQWGNNRIDAETVNSQAQGTPLASFMYTSLQGIKPIGAQVVPLVGARVCADGSFTGENCTGVVDSINVCANIIDGTTTFRVCGLDVAHSSNGSRLVQHGDSGGAVYSYDPTHSNVQPEGLISAGNIAPGQPGNQMLFTDILQICNQNPPSRC